MKDIILDQLCFVIRNFANRNAFFISGKYYSYHQFAERISVIRWGIRSADYNERIYALAAHDDIDTYAAIFALWMEGKAYVPLNPNQPIERNINIANQVNCKYIIDSKIESEFALNASSYNVICTELLPNLIDCLDNYAETKDDDLAYILFTSGSTGLPKGVPLSRKNLSSFVKSFWSIGYNINENDRFLQCFDLTFDLSIISYLIPLLRGACVYTVPYEVTKYLYIASLLMKQNITFALMTPSTLSYLAPYFNEMSFNHLKYSLFCGEALSTDLALKWSKCIPNAVIDNVYGPTENTIFCSVYRLRGENNLEYNGVLSIGKPIEGNKFIVVDEFNEEVKESNIGELCLSGDQLTLGYWNNPTKNEESFWIASDGTRYYRSGDLCFYGEDDNLLYVGRIDSQTKIQGFRVELGEIEHHARSFYANQYRVIAIAFQNANNITELALFVESNKGDSKQLLDYLRGKLPHYMIPDLVIFEPSFPINMSEKVDRKALKNKLKGLLKDS